MVDQYSYVDINEIIRDIKEKYKLYPVEDVLEIIMDNVKKGFSFNGQLLKSVADEFFNPFSNKKSHWFHFLCPVCAKKAKKLYVINGVSIKCYKCSKIKNKTKVNTQADRVIRIQKHLADVFGKKRLSSKQKNRTIEYIVTHFNTLDKKYKMAYNTIVFKHLLNWCKEAMKDEENSSEYKRAINDVLSKLKDSKDILTKTALLNAKDI